MMRLRPSLLVGGAAVLALAGSVVLGLTFAAFSSTTSNSGSSFTAKLIFPGARSTSAWNLRDASSGSESTQDNVFAFDDGRTRTTTSWSTAYSSSRYLEFDLSAPLPADRSVGSPTFDFRFAANASGQTACFYFEVRRASTGAVLATYPSSGDAGCQTGTTYTTVSTAIPIVTDTGIANDLRIRLFGKNSGSSALRIERATVSGNVSYADFTLYPTLDVDAADTTPATTRWGIATSGDSAWYQSSSTWGSSFDGSKYLKFTFPAIVPNAAAVTSVSLDHGFRSTSGTTCVRYELFVGPALVASIGTDASPAGCNSTASFQTTNTTLTGIDTPAEANNLVVRVYFRSSTGQASQDDLVRVNVDYSLNTGACTSYGSQTVVTTRDARVEQGSPTSNFGTDSKLVVDTKSPNLNIRSLVYFTLPAIPGGCSVTDAVLRIYNLTSSGTRTINAYQASGSWTETGVTWNNQPGTTGSAAGSASGTGWRTWDVETQVEAMVSGTNDGFSLRDSVENSGTEFKQEYEAREGSTSGNPDPELHVTWG